jgi:transposase-like protein
MKRNPRRTFDQDFIHGAVKLVTQEGDSLATAAKAVDVCYTTLRQWCHKQLPKKSTLGSPTSDTPVLNDSNPKIASFESNFGKPS